MLLGGVWEAAGSVAHAPRLAVPATINVQKVCGFMGKLWGSRYNTRRWA